MKDKINVFASSNEKGSARMTEFGKTLLDDARFFWNGYKSLDVDLRFVVTEYPYGEQERPDYYNETYFDCELKECPDYLASAFGSPGHLYQQILSMRESGNSGMVLVLGGDAEISAAIKDSVYSRYHKPAERAWNIASMEDRLIDFEANAAALGIPVVRWQARPWRKLLSTVHKSLTGGNLTGYRPRPAANEREVVAASLLFSGMGPTTLKPILEDYTLRLIPRGDTARNPEDFPGIGRKRAALLDGMICKIFGMVRA